MFNAAKGLPVILCSLVALAVTAQDGLRPDLTGTEKPLIYTGDREYRDIGNVISLRELLPSQPLWEGSTDQDLLASGLLDWLRRQLRQRLPVPDTRELLAEITAANLLYLYRTDAAGNIERDACGRAQLRESSGLEGQGGDLAGWSSRVTGTIDSLTQSWEQEARLICQEILISLPKDLAGRGEAQLSVTLAEYKRSVEREFERLHRQEKSLFLNARLRDTASLRQQSEAKSVASLTRALIDNTDKALAGVKAKMAADRSEAANPQGETAGMIEPPAADWQEHFQREFSNAIEVWSLAESRLIEERLRWEHSAEDSFLEGEEAWSNAYTELRKARSSWLDEFASLAQQGEKSWLQQEQFLLDSREQISAELWAAAERESARMAMEIEGLLNDYRRSRTLVSLAEGSLAALERQIDHTSDSAQHALCEEEKAYWEDILSRCDEQADNTLRNLYILEEEILSGNDQQAGDSYSRELDRLQARVDHLERQVEIAEAVARYAECHTSERPTRAESAAFYEAAQTFFADSESKYLAALDQLEQIDRQLLEAEALLTLLNEDIAGTRQDLVDAENDYELANRFALIGAAGLPSDLIRSDLSVVRDYYAAGREAIYREFFHLWEMVLRNEDLQTAGSLVSRIREGSSETPAVAELQERMNKLEDFELDWSLLPEELETRLLLAGADTGTPYVSELLEAYGVRFRDEVSPTTEGLAALRAGYYLAKIKQNTRLELWQSQTTIELLQAEELDTPPAALAEADMAAAAAEYDYYYQKALLEKKVLQALLSPPTQPSAAVEFLGGIIAGNSRYSPSDIEARVDELENICGRLRAWQRGEQIRRDRVLADFLQGRDAFTIDGFDYTDCFLLAEDESRSQTRAFQAATAAMMHLAPGFSAYLRNERQSALQALLGADDNNGDSHSFSRLDGISGLDDLLDLFTSLYALRLPPYLLEMIRSSLAFRCSEWVPDLQTQLAETGGELAAADDIEAFLASGIAGVLEQAGLLYLHGLPGAEQFLAAALAAEVMTAQEQGTGFDTAFTRFLQQSGVEDFSRLTVIAAIEELKAGPVARPGEDSYLPLLDGGIEDFISRRYAGSDPYRQAVLEEQFLNPEATLLALQRNILQRYSDWALKAIRQEQEDLEKRLFVLAQIRQIGELPHESEILFSAGTETLTSNEEAAYRHYLSLALAEFAKPGLNPDITSGMAAAAAARVAGRASEITGLEHRVKEYQEALIRWQNETENYAINTLQPLAARLEECRSLYEQARAAFRRQMTVMENLVAGYNTRREAADVAYRNYREAGYRLQEAEETDDYALSGSVAGGNDPQKILDQRLQEYRQAQQILTLLTGLYEPGEEQLPFSVRNPQYAALKREYDRMLEHHIRLSHIREQMENEALDKQRESAQAMEKLATQSGRLVDLGDVNLKIDADTLTLDAGALTDFSCPDTFTEAELADYFSNSDGKFARDALIWLAKLERLMIKDDLKGDGLKYIHLASIPEYARLLPPGLESLRIPIGLADTGLMGLFKDFAFACFYETGEVEIAAESQQAYRLLSDEIDADPNGHLRALGRKSLQELRQNPDQYKLYSFFKLLWSEDKLLFDTAFLGFDLSYEAVKYLKAKANEAIDDIKKRYPIIHIFMFRKKKRIRSYRDSLQFIHGGPGKRILAREIYRFGAAEKTYKYSDEELALLLGRPGMSCPEFMQALRIALGEEIDAETAEYIRSLFPAGPDAAPGGSADILNTLIEQTASRCGTIRTEIEYTLAQHRSDRAKKRADYQHLLRCRDDSVQQLADVAEILFHNPAFTEEDLNWSDYEYAKDLQLRTPYAPLPALQLRGSALSAIYRQKLAAVLKLEEAGIALQLESLQKRKLEWQRRIEDLYAAGINEWQAGLAELSAKRRHWQQGFRAEYEEKVALWDRKYELFEAVRQTWLEESTELGYAAACQALAREMGIKADSLSTGVENIIVPDITGAAPPLSALIRDISGRRGLHEILDGTRTATQTFPSRILLRQAYLPLSRTFRSSLVAQREFQSGLDEEIYKKAALVNALRMREIVSMTREEIQALITDANKNAARQVGNTLLAAGYRGQGNAYQRSALIDRTILGGIEEEQQYIRGYSPFRAPELEVGVKLNRSILEGLSGELIQAAVKKAVAQLQEYMRLIFGQADLEAATDISADFRARMDAERKRFQSSAQYAEYTEIKGLFAMHVGYAPVMKENDPEEVASAGYGEYGRIFELFLRNEARLSRGLATLSIPLYDLRLWDDDRDNDGEPDGWFHAPTPRGIIDLSVSVIGTVLLGPGSGLLAVSLIDDAVFTGMDIAGGRSDWSEAGLGLGKKALVGLVSQGFASLEASAMEQVSGSLEGVIAKTIFSGGSRFAENLVSGTISAVEIRGGGLRLNSDVLEEKLVGQSALIGTAAGMSGTFIREGLDALTLGYENTAGLSHLHIEDAAVFNRTLGSLAGAAVEYGLEGETGLNILNLRDFSRQGPEHGLLELTLGNRDSYLNIGSGGYNLSTGRIARAAKGFGVQRTNRQIKRFATAYEETSGYKTDIMLRAEYSFGDELGRDTLTNILAGTDFLHIGLADAEGMTVRRQGGGRDIYLEPVGDSLTDQLYAAVLLQHEAQRDGVISRDNHLETRAAVTSRLRMAERIVPDYGDAFILGHDTLVKDFMAREMSQRLGLEFWNDYIDNSYSSQADFARRILNWKRRGRVGVMRTPDAFGIADALFGGFSSLARMARLSSGDRRDITAKEPNELEDLLSGTLTMITLGSSAVATGLTQGITAARLVDFAFTALSPLPQIPNGSLAGVLNFSAGISRQVLQAREIMQYVLRDDMDECTRWHTEKNRDKQIFAMADAIGIDLSVDYNTENSDEYYQVVEQQMVMRYIWLGNRMFNDKIMDPEDLKMLFYGPYVDVFDEEHGLRQYVKLPGYIDKESKEFFGRGDHSEYGDDFFKKYRQNFETANILSQKSCLSAPVNWSQDHIRNVNNHWNTKGKKQNYYYSYTSYWELRYKNLMLSLEE